MAYRKKKRVSWAEDDNLVMVHYFEMDESERGDYKENNFLPLPGRSLRACMIGEYK